MKIAIFVVGEHFAGKSSTINDFLKPRLGIPNKNKFIFKSEYKGFIYSQSFEECKANIESRLDKIKQYDILIISARPRWEKPSDLNELIAGVTRRGFTYQEFFITKGIETEATYYEHQALAILGLLDNLLV
ncbi:hypothetical protein [uncultured Pseudodesulfovibrio sp.]|uniref:hypothetical protein n=1 Tax=uncultured Pseudodesulfovibrio sp. TaxID=2035858 RepID=UPI0029C793B6|nr:hypothetical protein [uncultured Pseudodesulfovibrio sp.]